MDYKLRLSQYLTDAAVQVSPQAFTAACTGQGCTTCEGGGCEEMGCQTCQCVYESGQCGQDCGQGCSESCSQGCAQSAQTPDYYLSNWTDISCTVTITQAGSYRIYRVLVRLASSSMELGGPHWYTISSGTASKTISGLTPNTDYVVNVGYGTVSGGNVEWIGGTSFTTNAPPTPTVSKWSWGTSNGSASTAQTQLALRALNGTTPGVENFSYVVWNDLVDKIMQMRNAKNLGWYTDGSGIISYAATRMTAADRAMSAKRFNSARRQISSVVATSAPIVSVGQTVVGGYFTMLTAGLNAAIDTI